MASPNGMPQDPPPPHVPRRHSVPTSRIRRLLPSPSIPRMSSAPTSPAVLPTPISPVPHRCSALTKAEVATSPSSSRPPTPLWTLPPLTSTTGAWRPRAISGTPSLAAGSGPGSAKRRAAQAESKAAHRLQDGGRAAVPRGCPKQSPGPSWATSYPHRRASTSQA